MTPAEELAIREELDGRGLTPARELELRERLEGGAAPTAATPLDFTIMTDTDFLDRFGGTPKDKLPPGVQYELERRAEGAAFREAFRNYTLAGAAASSAEYGPEVNAQGQARPVPTFLPVRPSFFMTEADRRRAKASGNRDVLTGFGAPDPTATAPLNTPVFTGVDIPGVLEQRRIFQERRALEGDTAARLSSLNTGTAAGIREFLAGLVGGATSPETLVGPAGEAGALGKTLVGAISRMGRAGTVNAGIEAAINPLAQTTAIRTSKQPDQEFDWTAYGTGILGAAAFGAALRGAGEGVGAVVRRGRELAQAVGKKTGKDPDTVTAADLESVMADPDVRRVLEASKVELDNLSPEEAARVQELVARVETRRAEEAQGLGRSERREQVKNIETARTQVADQTRAQLRESGLPPERIEEMARERALNAAPDPGPARPPDVIEGGARTEGGLETVYPRESANIGAEAGRAQVLIGDTERAAIRERFGFVPESIDQQRSMLNVLREAEGAQTRANAQGQFRVTDTSGEARTSPQSQPMRPGLHGEFKNTAAPKQPTAPELDASGRPYARTSTGTSDRPFRDQVGGQEHAARVDELRTQAGEAVRRGDLREANRLHDQLDELQARERQARAFEQRQRDDFETLRRRSIDDLEREWAARRRAEDEARARGESVSRKAEEKYKSAEGSFSNKAAPEADGNFKIDEFGHVLSDRGGPIIFKNQKQAARWIVNVGHKKSPDQVFEIANHPGKTGAFTVRERLRRERTQKQQDEGATAKAAETGARRALPKPEEKPAGPGTKDEPKEPPREKGPEPAKPAEEPKPDRPATEPRAERAEPATEQREPALSERSKEWPAQKPTPKKPADETDILDDMPGFLRRKKADGEPKDATTDAKTADGEASKFSDKFYSNPFFDPDVWKSLGKTLEGPYGWSKEFAAGWIDGVRRIGEDLKGSSALTPLRAVADAWRTAFYRNVGVLAVLSRRYNSRGIERVLDMFHHRPGRNVEAVGRTYGEAVAIHQRTTVKEVSRILEPFQLKKATQRVQRSERERVRAQLDQVVRLVQNRRNIRVTGGGLIHETARKLAALLDKELQYLRDTGVEIGEVKDYFPRMLDTNTILKSPAKFTKAAAMLYRKAGATADEAAKLAEAWFGRILHSDLGFSLDGNDFVLTGVRGLREKFEKGRVFGKEADDLLRAFYITDPEEALGAYFFRSSRRAEWTRRFGANLETWKDIKAQMESEGAGEAVGEVARIIQSMIGSMALPRGGWRPIAASLQVFSAMSFLPRATFSALAEPAVTFMRTGNGMDALQGFRRTLQYAVGNLLKTKNHAEARAFAEDIGTIAGIAQDVMELRTAGEVEGKTARRILTAYFKGTLLHQWTEWTRMAATRGGQTFVRRLALDVAEERAMRKSARYMLKELGVAEKDIDGFAAWVKAREAEGGVTALDLAGDTGHAGTYRTAIVRFVTSGVIMEPTAAERPRYANHPLAKVIYTLQAYQDAFHGNVLTRLVRTTRHALDPAADLGLADRARLLSQLAGIPVLFGLQWAQGELRDLLFQDPARADLPPRTDSEKAWLAVSRAGYFGKFDTLVNFISSVRFQRDPATIMLGAPLGKLAELTKSAIGLTSDRNSQNTNTAERTLMRNIYDVVIDPVLTAATTYAPLPARIPLIQFLSHPWTREQYVAPAAGKQAPRGSRGGRGLYGG